MRRLPAVAKESSCASQLCPLLEETSRLRSAMAQTSLPSAETSTDCASLCASGSLPAFCQVLPSSEEVSTPPVVAAYHAPLPKAMSFTRKAESTGAFFTGAFAAGAAAFLPFVVVVVFTAAAAGASGTYRPVRTQCFEVSSYFDQPPLVREAHQPIGVA